MTAATPVIAQRHFTMTRQIRTLASPTWQGGNAGRLAPAYRPSESTALAARPPLLHEGGHQILG